MRRFGAAVCLLWTTAALGAVRGREVMYVGGTPGLPEKTEGKLDLDSSAARFTSARGEIAIPYAGVSSLEYGQKVGRRVGAAVAVSPVALLSKKRKHYLTIGYADANGARQAAVLELPKGLVREVLDTLQTRSGKAIVFESPEAKRQFEREAR